MAELRRRRVDIGVEKRILTGLAVSDKVCRELIPAIKPEYLQSEYAAIVFKWIRAYYNSYEKAPGRAHLRDLFEVEKSKIKPSAVPVVEDFLVELSGKYEEEESFNADYCIDNGLVYSAERGLRILNKNVSALLDIGRVKEAEALWATYRKASKQTSTWISPFEPKEINRVFDYQKEDVLFRFPGKLGELAGDFERGHFIGFMGPTKRTKSWWLQELAILGVMYRLKVAFISLEMRDVKIERRLYKRVTSAVEQGGSVVYPCFDCLSNQDGSCQRKVRQNKVTLLDEDGNAPKYRAILKYRPCTYCRFKDPEHFIPSTWFTMVERPKFTRVTVRKAVKAVSSTYQLLKNFRLKAYPRFSANISDIKHDLDILEFSEGFVPDVIIIDYADILKPEKERTDGREMVDETWKTLGGLAAERRCLVVTATQTNKASWDRKTTRSSDVSEDYRKIPHVDGMFIISQTGKEKGRGVMRLSVVLRDQDFNELRQVTVLQQLQAGQPFIDSEIIREDY